MKSFSILRTNVGLTTNVKVMVDSEYNLFLESIDSAPELSNTKYKKLQFNKNNYYDELVPFFFKNLPPDIAYKIKYDDDSDNMFSDFNKQYDDIYQMGSKNVINNVGYTEEFECFAPLYISKTNIPKNFIIFRVDGPGLETLNRDNFKSEMVDKLKCVKVFDLTKKTALGEWIDTNFVRNVSFPETPFEMDYRRLEFTSWNGIDYSDGGYTKRSTMLDSTLEYENTYHDLERFVFDGFKNNKIIFPNILNFSFLFDDTPSTPDTIRKWSINRYLGFYIDDLENIKSVSSYLPQVLKTDVIIESGNILKSVSSNSPFDDNIKLSEFIYIEISGVFYKVEHFEETVSSTLSKIKISPNSFDERIVNSVITKYKIISDIDFTGVTYSSLNKNIIDINSDNKITLLDGGSFTIDNFDSADVWIIEIGDKFHNLKNINNEIFIETDYAFDVSLEKVDYWVNNPDPKYRKSISLVVDSENLPKTFKIFKVKFSDIKDFDTTILDTDFSKHEYIKKNEITQTDETKMYTVNYDSDRNPKDFNDYSINGQVIHIPTSSEYTSNGETFRLVDRDLSNLWRKNSERVKWGFQNSLSSNDYPYLLNNSFSAEDFNRSVNTFDPKPHRHERNLDYFYTTNPSLSSYSHHSLHVEDVFDLNGYLENNYDYFTNFFGKKSTFDSGNFIKNTKKWSYFNNGDKIIPNITLFRGIKFKLYDVSGVKITDNVINNINIKSSNTYDDYKFSILLSKNNQSINLSSNNIGLTSSVSNNMIWKIIDTFKHDKTYYPGDYVNVNDRLFVNTATASINDPNKYPEDGDGWVVKGDTIFWADNIAYDNINETSFLFNNPPRYYVYTDGEYWISLSTDDNSRPSISNSVWRIVELWDSIKVYKDTDYVVFNDTLYKWIRLDGIPTQSELSPDLDNINWIREYSIVPDTNYVYGSTFYQNSIILQNNRYYYCVSNATNNTLENGINIYVNKKFKNVLVNIYVNDNTLDRLSNIDRDFIYNDLYSKLTASNFINVLNDPSNKFGFSDSIKYIIIDADIKIYDFSDINKFSVTNLPCLLTCEGPDELSSRVSSLNILPVSLGVSQFKPKRKLDKGNIVTIDMLNYYNNISLGTTINKNVKDDALVENFSGLKNNIFNTLYRHSGYYMPIFTDVELFSVGNYIFDTSLTEFGIIKERVISKINRSGNILKLKNSPDLRSIYPMIDEFGYTTTNFFIFKSNWDFEYHIECVDVKQVEPITSNESLNVIFNTNNLSE